MHLGLCVGIRDESGESVFCLGLCVFNTKWSVECNVQNALTSLLCFPGKIGYLGCFGHCLGKRAADFRPEEPQEGRACIPYEPFSHSLLVGWASSACWDPLGPPGAALLWNWGSQLHPGTVLAHAVYQGCEMQEKNIPDMYPTPRFSSTLYISGFCCYYHIPSVFCLWSLENWGTNWEWTLLIEADFMFLMWTGEKGKGGQQ